MIDNGPLVSIITLTYNRRNIIDRSIVSALNQSYANFELIVIDDGSSDETGEFITNKRDERIFYYYFQHTGNVAKLRNIGIRRANGKYIAFLDSDDLWKPNKLSEQVKLLEKFPNAAITFCATRRWNVKGVIKENHFSHLEIEMFPQDLFLKFIANDIIVIPSASLFRKSVMDTVGYSNEELITGDIEFMSRILFHGEAILDKRVLVEMTRNDDNMTKFIQVESFQEYLFMLDKYYKMNKIGRPLYSKMYARMSYHLATHYMGQNDTNNAREVLLSIIRKRPIHIKALAMLIKTYI